MPDAAVILGNLLAGKSAMGNTDRFAHRVTLGKNPALRITAIRALDIAADIFGDIPDPTVDARFSGFARKMLVYANRGGTLVQNPDFITRVTLAAALAATRKSLCFGNAAFGAIHKLAREDQARLTRVKSKTPSRFDEIETMRAQMKTPPAAPPIRWQSKEGLYALHELTTPFDVWAEGVRLNNCLSRVNPYAYTTHINGDDPPGLLPTLGYWQVIRQGDIQLYSLRSGTCTIALLGVCQGALREATIPFPREPRLWDNLADISLFFERRYGVFALDFMFPNVVQRILAAKLMVLRRKRGRMTVDLQDTNRPRRQLRSPAFLALHGDTP